jgi:dephospho-CoA kinase
VAPDPSWPAQAQRLLDRIRVAAGNTALTLDHVGSTAIPHLAAKDVIDLQLGVESLDSTDHLADALRHAGFPAQLDITADNPKPVDPDPAHWRKRVHRNADPGRDVNLHVREVGSAGWRYALMFRDWLRADESERASYEAHKRKLAAAHAADVSIVNYAEAKEPWFDNALPRAEAWAKATGWPPG